MDLQLIGQNVEILPTVRNYVEKKLGKLNRHLPNMSGIKVELAEHKTRAADQRFRAQVTLEVNGTLLRAEERAENLLVAIDSVVPSLDRQIERYKSKLSRKNKTGTIRGTAQEEKVDDTEEIPNVVRVKRFPVKLMLVEEAIDQMELLGHNFFLFSNAETKELNLLYRRADGNYSVIEPELE
jgi:putative sigma-54 modulation protein